MRDILPEATLMARYIQDPTYGQPPIDVVLLPVQRGVGLDDHGFLDPLLELLATQHEGIDCSIAKLRQRDTQSLAQACNAGRSAIISVEPFIVTKCRLRKSLSVRVTVSRELPINSAIS